MNEESLFHQALQQPDATARAAFLDQACANQPELRARLEKLLQAHEAPVALIDQPAVGGATSDVAAGRWIDSAAALRLSEGPGTRIGPYKLLQQIGEGGMGVVYMAEQESPVRRRVALKIIKPGMDSAQVVARFEAERQALALMDHPNIAKVHDGGTTPAGPPYFVMELVKGLPITKYCDEQRLTPRQRLELFVPVCSAVQHAHQKGIIHRDLKPSNVLVGLYDGKPVPKVIDFGVAKAAGQPLTDKTLVTGFGAVVGTPEYMSPEQAQLDNLDIDTRSDVYALGVLLYELLTGTTPLERRRLKEGALLEMLRLIREEEPPRPSTRLSTTEQLPSIAASRGLEPKKLSGLVRGELDWIVMKALEKDRNRRYETASAFAADVQRYLADEPVQACPPSAAYRLRKFARRNKAALAVAAVVLLCIAAVGGGGSWLVGERLARQRAAEGKVLEALKAAEPLLREGLPGNPALVSAAQRVEAELDSGNLGPVVRHRAEQLRRDMRMLAELEQIRLSQAEGKETAMFDSAGAEKRYAAAFSAYGLDVMALEPSQAAARLRESSIRETLLGGLDAWMQLKQASDGGRTWLKAVADGTDDSTWRRAFREAALAGNTEQLQALAGQAEALAQPPGVLAWLGSVLNAAGLGKEAEAILRQAQQRYPGDFWLNYDLGHFLTFGPPPRHPEMALGYFRAAVAIRPGSAEARSILGIALLETGETDEAIAALRQAIALDPNFATARINLGHALRQKGQLDEAIVEYREAVRVEKDFPEAHFCLANALKDKGLLDEAITEYREMLRFQKGFAAAHSHRYLLPTQQADYDRHQREFAEATVKLVNALKAKGRSDEAIAELAKAVERDPKDAAAHYNLGNALIDQSKWDEAIAHLTRALALRPDDPRATEALGRALRDKAWAQGDRAGLEKALAEFDRAIKLEPKNTSFLWERSRCCFLLGQDDRALADANQILELDPKHTAALLQRALTYCRRRQYDDALADCNKAIELAPKFWWAWDVRGHIHCALHRYEEAFADMDRAVDLDPTCWWAWDDRADFYLGLRRYDEAVADYSRSLELGGRYAGTWINRAAAYCGLGQYDKARADLLQARKLAAKGGNLPYRLALLHLKLGDGPAYHRQCQAMLDSLGGATPEAVRFTAWSCVMGPDSGASPDRVMKLAETLVAQNPKSRSDQTILGAALYRAGRFQEAVRQLDQAAALPAEPFQPPEYTWFFLAMAHQRLGHGVEARQWLDKARQPKEPKNKDAHMPWNRRLTLQMLCGEAEALLGSKEEKAPPENGKAGKQKSEG